MKYKKLINKLEEHSFGVKRAGDFLHIFIASFSDELVAKVKISGTDLTSVDDCEYEDDNDLHLEAKAFLLGSLHRYFATPIEKRDLPEIKYVIPWSADEYEHNYLRYNGYTWGIDDDYENSQFTEADLDRIKKDNPNLAKAIDVLKEPVEE